MFKLESKLRIVTIFFFCFNGIIYLNIKFKSLKRGENFKRSGIPSAIGCKKILSDIVPLKFFVSFQIIFKFNIKDYYFYMNAAFFYYKEIITMNSDMAEPFKSYNTIKNRPSELDLYMWNQPLFAVKATTEIHLLKFLKCLY